MPYFEYEEKPSVDLIKRFACFNQIADNSNTKYSIILYVDIPNNNDPDDLIQNKLVGHTFISVSKRNGNQIITQNFGFYPHQDIKAPINPYSNYKNQISDDGNHEYNASISLNSINKEEFEKIINVSKSLSNNMDYSLYKSNCTDFGIAVFNSILPINNQIKIPLTSYIGIEFKSTPSALYKYLLQKRNSTNNIEIKTSKSSVSHGDCN